MEGFRPGVAERLGLGPDVCLARNPRLVYGRMTGWGQDGPDGPGRRPRHRLHRPGRRPRGRSAGPASGRCRRSTWSATSAAAACCSPSACWPPSSAPSTTGKGQVVDAAMVDGAASLMTMTYTLRSAGIWHGRPGHQPARHRRPLLRGLRDLRRRVHRRRRHRAPVLRRADPAARAGRRGPARPRWTGRTWPAMKERFAAIFATQDPGRVGGRLRRDRRLRGAGAVAGRGARPPPQPVPGDLHRGGRRRPARPGPPVPVAPRARSAGRRPIRASTPTRRWPTGASPPTRSTGCAPRAPSPEPAGRSSGLRSGPDRYRGMGYPDEGATGHWLPAWGTGRRRASEVDDRAGDGAGDPLDQLDPAHHHLAELVHRRRLGPDDHVVGPVTPSAATTPSRMATARATWPPCRPRSGSARRR